MEESQMIELANKKIIDFAESQNPKVWHQMTMDWNWASTRQTGETHPYTESLMDSRIKCN